MPSSPSVAVEPPAAEPDTSSGQELSGSGSPGMRVGVEQIAWAAATLVAVLTRLPALGLLPLSLADSSRAYAAWQVAGGRFPGYWSGDLVQTLTAAVFKLAGAGDGRARLISALLGAGLVAAIWLYRPLIGRAPALLAGYFIAVSPVCIAISRSLSPYGAGALLSVAAGAALLLFIAEPRPAPLAWLAGILGLGLSTDATFLIFVLAAVLYCIVEGVWLRRAELVRAGEFLRGRAPLMRSALLIGLAGLLVATTRFGVAPDRLRSGATLSFSADFTTAGSSTSAGPTWQFQLDNLVFYEPFLLMGGAAGAIYLLLRRTESLTAAERFLLYWAAAGLAFALVAARPDAGQLPVLLAPLALLAALGCSRCLAFARWDLLKQGVAPALLAAPALVYVLFVLETTAMNTRLSPGQQVSLAFLFIGGIGLIVLGAVWSRNSAPAYLAICGLLVGSAYALHSATRVGFASGDEFLLGPVATADASGLADALAEAGPGLRGGISIDPALTAPLAWYTRENPFVRIQPATAASAAIVQPVDLAQPPGFTPLVARSEVAREWYPSTIDPGGVLRWLLYRQAWQPVRSTYAQALVRAEPP